ncbi:MAG: phosphate acetyltransferase [Deltaproteobacteria bacterium]|jgi:phosphate acetyltransferase|nr:phosphate acetyltransferase [Deltaproteobacteria bacterium]
MVRSVFIAAPHSAEKKDFIDALIGGHPGSEKPGWFKTVVSDADKERLADKAAKLGAQEEELYGLDLHEALELLNLGREGEIVEKVLGKFHAAAQKFTCLPVEGADLDVSGAFGLQALDGVLAANLASPVAVVSKCVTCAATVTRVYRGACAEVIGVVLLGDHQGEAVKRALEPLGVPVQRAADVAAAKACIPELGARVQAFKPANVTPKRFEYDLIERAKSDRQRIVLPEGDDDRILEAADAVLRREFAEILILGDPAAIGKKASELGLRHLERAQLLDLRTAPFRQELVDLFYELRKAKGVTPEKAQEQLYDRNWFGTMMVKAGKADGMVSGAAGSTADTIRPALSVIKTARGSSIASSVFLMCMRDRVLVFGDCAIVTNPTPQQLAEIAVMSAKTAKAFGVEPRVALLSYSTGSSGTGPDVDAVKEAVEAARKSLPELYPDLALDGPMQFDAALDPRTAKSKMPGSPVAGRATVLVFPTLNAGNIGYKAVQRTSGAVAVGPIIQGLNAPVNDLSRGCTVPDIINTVAITACQAQAR